MNNEKLKSWLWTGFIAIILLFFVLSGFKSCKNKRIEKKAKAQTEETQRAANKATRLSQQNTVVEMPKTLPDEHYLLKKGEEPKRVYMHDGYKCDYYGGGKKYYHQAQNGKSEIWGGGNCPTGLGSPYATYADLWYYDEEITVVCKFTLKQ